MFNLHSLTYEADACAAAAVGDGNAQVGRQGADLALGEAPEMYWRKLKEETQGFQLESNFIFLLGLNL